MKKKLFRKWKVICREEISMYISFLSLSKLHLGMLSYASSNQMTNPYSVLTKYFLIFIAKEVPYGTQIGEIHT